MRQDVFCIVVALGVHFSQVCIALLEVRVLPDRCVLALALLCQQEDVLLFHVGRCAVGSVWESAQPAGQLFGGGAGAAESGWDGETEDQSPVSLVTLLQARAVIAVSIVPVR